MIQKYYLLQEFSASVGLWLSEKASVTYIGVKPGNSKLIGKTDTMATAHSMTTSTNWNEGSKPQISASQQDAVVL